jgi:hypothetical protein
MRRDTVESGNMVYKNTQSDVSDYCSAKLIDNPNKLVLPAKV